ncbi:transglycosylase SLT domain-containing protein [Roseococcus thiosulfatophilus]|uniref:transglycosylase SLT domain-containing protein n=1 Tax=Roseococcus thiosulfatophilus TaxID=35813 RepID=UPI001A8E2858|nr:transglycosylase SLT domain-containing protein [Roseococcus thiosulfatophilus]
MARPPLRGADLTAPRLPGQNATPQAIAPRVDTGAMPNAAQAIGGLRATIESIGRDLNRQADFTAEEAAWEAGTRAGAENPGTLMEGGGIIYRSAFNRAAVDSASRTLEVQARTELSRLALEHRQDPEAFMRAAEAWRDTTRAALPTRIGVRFATGFDTLALSQLGDIRERQERAVRDQAVATWMEALPGRLAGIQQSGQRALVDPNAARALADQEAQALAELAALGPREGFTLNGRAYGPDPTRAGALSVAQLAERSERLRQAGREALVVGAWRAAGGGTEWIDRFEQGATMPGGTWTQRNAAAGRVLATPQQLAARLPSAWAPIIQQAAQANGLEPGLLAALIGLESGGRAGATSPAGARGPAQIMPATARDPGFGMPPLPEAALNDPAQAIPWGAAYLARLRDHFGGDMAKALAAYNAGPGRVEQAERAGGLLPAETRNYLATLLPAAIEGGQVLTSEEARGIAGRLRALHASELQATNEVRGAARTELGRLVTENMNAIAAQGRPLHILPPDLIERAGQDPAELAAREQAAVERYAATRTARDTTDPAELARLAAQFAPGTPAFAADPAAAVQLLNSLAARGVQVEGAAAVERVRDLEAEAAATGRAGALTEAEARAAGLTPERRDEINRNLALTAELARLRQEAERLPPEEREAARANLPVRGAEASENARRLRVLSEAFEARDRAVREDAAAYALAGSQDAQALAREALTNPAALTALANRLLDEQAQIGVPEAQRRALPKPMVQALFDRILDAADPDAAEGALRLLVQGVGAQEAARLVGGLRMEGGLQGERREAVAVAIGLAGRGDDTSRRILRGVHVLRDNPMPGQTAAQMEARLDAHLGAALARAPDVRSQALSAARAIYAAGISDAGALGSGRFDPGRFNEALERLVPVARYSGQTVLLPPGMAPERFRDVMASLPAERLAGAMAADGTPITPGMIARGGFTLEAVGPGRYVLGWHGREVLDREAPAGSRRPFVLDLNGAAPAETAGPAAPATRRPSGRMMPSAPMAEP